MDTPQEPAKSYYRLLRWTLLFCYFLRGDTGEQTVAGKPVANKVEPRYFFPYRNHNQGHCPGETGSAGPKQALSLFYFFLKLEQRRLAEFSPR